MSQQSRVPFRLIRFKNFLFHLLKNKMAFTGLVVLTLFVAFAVTAPILTPYTPQGTIVSGVSDPPAWSPLLSGSSDWSLNSAFSFPNTPVDPTAGTTVTITSPDSVLLNVSASQLPGGTVTLQKTLNYQYNGPPKTFSGNVKITPTGLAGTSGATVKVYIQRQGDQQWLLWQQPGINASRLYTPGISFYSDDPVLQKNFNLPANSGFSPAQIIFNHKGSYVYALEITLPVGVSNASFSIEDFRMFLPGTVWGRLGTDDSGHDLFTALAWGARVSIEVGLLATFLGIGVGLVVGLLAGFLAGFFDEVLMRFTDMMLVLPGLPLLIVLVAVLGASTLNIILVLGLLGWMGFARIIRSQVLSLRERPFIEAARASGAGTFYITSKHIFPNIVSLTYVNLALSVPAAIVGEAALSFLGLGASGVTWGRMLQEAKSAGASAGFLLWWWIIPPGICIAALSLSFILIGYSLDEMFNPRLRKRR